MRALIVVTVLLPAVSSLLLYGCTLTDNLCEENETCYPDGVFGQCFSPVYGVPEPTVLTELDEAQLELLRLELLRIYKAGNEWADEQTQCVLAYYKLSMSYDLLYDPNFCQVHNPAKVWGLLQLIGMGLNVDNSVEDEVNPQQVLLLDDEVGDERSQYDRDAPAVEEVEMLVPLVPTDDEVPEDEIQQIIQQLNEPLPEIDLEEYVNQDDTIDPTVEQYMEKIVKNEDPDLSQLSDSQLNELISRLFTLKDNLSIAESADEQPEEVGEAEEAITLDNSALADQQQVLKKDAEEVGNVEMGLDNTVHKIVKGRNSGITRVVGNRVYLKVNIKAEQQLYPLIEFLQNTIALPNNLIFDDFQFDQGQLSMRINRLEGVKAPKDKRIDSVEGVAKAVYKRRKDIARFSGAEVAETGIGIGSESVPVESAERDWIFKPILIVCGLTITALISVLSIHLYKNRRYYHQNIKQMASSFDTKANLTYQDICRQRVGQEPNSGRASKSSSTSSWCGDEAQQPTIDIGTGHVVMNFLQEMLADPSRMEAQWDSINTYCNLTKEKNIGAQYTNKNRSIIPFDENLVPIEAWKNETAYINASFIYDDDPKQPVYMAAQTPQADDMVGFWQAIWQHGVCLIVNLTDTDEIRQDKNYWPAEGSQLHGPFEIHLVSEHIWSSDYMVRSFYLKNLQNNETRTITQFHYINWPKDSTPSSAKSLLEFRRKVNKSYRGRSSPLLVHSLDGCGRTGVYCAVDLLCNRLLRGVRQIDVVASVEHLRDQRDGMVRTGDQFRFIYGSVAQEVSMLIKKKDP
ncbi:unnamed protein product [Auanema sp. JU1783]|nr:unnamed protein product [Auanema sp. JU1783]